jgi:hypothetical protein
LVSEKTSPAKVPVALESTLLRLATGAVATQRAAPGAVAVLTEKVVKTMFLKTLWSATTSLLAFVVIVAGASLAAPWGSTKKQALAGAEKSQLVQGFSGSSAKFLGGPEKDSRAEAPLSETEFFSAADRAVTFAYVIDRSGSMATRDSLEVVKRELRESLGKLGPDARFLVVFYNLGTTVLTDANGRRGIMLAHERNKASVRVQLEAIKPDGGTDHLLGLRAALAEKPEVVYFMTDSDLMSGADVATISAEAGKTRIHTVEFGRRKDPGEIKPLRSLAKKTGGTYRYIDVTSLSDH